MPLWLPASGATQAIEQQLYLCQAWHELLHPQSPDTFRARVVNLPLLLDDLLHVVEIASDDARWTGYLPSLGSELEEHLLSEQRLIAPSSQLWRAIESVVHDAKQQRVPTLKSKVLVSKGLFGSTENRFVPDLLDLVANQPNRKEGILSRLSSIASHIAYRGQTEEALDLLSRINLTDAPRDIAGNLCSLLSASQQIFACHLAVSGDREILPLLLKRTPFRRVRENSLRDQPNFANWAAECSDCIFFKIDIKDYSHHSAAEKAMRTLSESLNIHNLYTNSASFRVRSSVLIRNSSNAYSSVQVAPSSHFGLMPRSRALKLSIDRMSRVGKRVEGRLSNALECHAIALAAREPTTALINLWTALEAISGSAQGISIGQKVSRSVAPIIASRRIDKIASYLAISCHEMLVHNEHFVDRKALPHSQFTKVSNDDIMQAIAGPNNNAGMKYLLGICQDSPMLRQRLYFVWKDFHDPDAVRKNLIASRRRVEWQIERIYRARNLIVHKGETSHLLWRLLQNAQYYVSATLSRILHDLSDHPEWGIDESLSYQEMQFNHVCSSLESGKGLSHADVLGSRTSAGALRLWQQP
ncbi:MAG TPA: hypothetical protein VJ806_00410 [Luteimonas sp.]|nr:hypothetical protein [Luteimonas sp.]